MAKTKFNGQEHLDFYEAMIEKCRYQDVYHQALIYCLGISSDTRAAINDIYDFKEGLMKPECLHSGWITSGSARVIRLAFNLYCNGTPSIQELQGNDQLKECQLYTVEELFCCSYARYFWEAVKIRYPEYCD